MYGQGRDSDEWAGEVTVVLHIERIVTFALWSIDCFVHAAKHCKIHGIFKRCTLNQIKYLLNIKAAFYTLHGTPISRQTVQADEAYAFQVQDGYDVKNAVLDRLAKSRRLDWPPA